MKKEGQCGALFCAFQELTIWLGHRDIASRKLSGRRVTRRGVSQGPSRVMDNRTMQKSLLEVVQWLKAWAPEPNFLGLNPASATYKLIDLAPLMHVSYKLILAKCLKIRPGAQ